MKIKEGSALPRPTPVLPSKGHLLRNIGDARTVYMLILYSKGLVRENLYQALGAKNHRLLQGLRMKGLSNQTLGEGDKHPDPEAQNEGTLQPSFGTKAL